MAHVVAQEVICRDVSRLWPVFAARVASALVDAKAAGMNVEIFESYRSPERQGYLFNQGRKAPGKIVTWSEPGMSWHQYGCAVDLVFRDAKGNWSWGGPYSELAKFMKGKGLEWLGPKDQPHFQLTGGMPVAEAKKMGDLQKIWAVIGARLGLSPSV